MPSTMSDASNKIGPLRQIVEPAFRILLSLLTGFLAVRWQKPLGLYAATHPAFAPICLVFLLGCMLTDRFRQWLFASLASGIGFLALSDFNGITRLPAEIDYTSVERFLPSLWASIAFVALLSGSGLALK